MIVKSQKRIEFINDCNCIVDYNELEKDLFENGSNYVIPKQIVKDKIEEYDKQRIKMEKDDIGVGFTLGKEWSDLKAKIEALQDLLEKE